MSFIYEDWKFNELGDDAFYVEKYLGNGGDVIIPSMVNGKPVTVIGKSAFSSWTNDNLISVTIPKTVVRIEKKAFDCCNHLKQVNGCEGLDVIEKSAFIGCSMLENIPLGMVFEIGNSAFMNCYRLKNISLTNVKTIEDAAFWCCKSLNEVIIPSCIETLGLNAFYKCSSLSSADLPESVYTQDLSSFFGGTPFLTKIKLAGSYTNLQNKQNQHSQQNQQNKQETANHNEQQSVVTAGDYTLVRNDDGTWAIKNYTGSDIVPIVASKRGDGRTVTKILPYAFSSSKVIAVYIDEGITEIESEAFYGCKDLAYAELPDSLKKLGTNAFEYCSQLINVRLPRSLDNQAQLFASFLYTPFIQARTGNPVKSKIDTLFNYENGIWSLKRYIGYLNELTLLSKLPDKTKVTIILPQAFRCRPDVKEVTISKGFTEICSDAFADCIGLEKVVIPDSINKIGPNAFRGCTRLTEVKMPQRLMNTDVISSSFAGTPFGDRIIAELNKTTQTDITYTSNSEHVQTLSDANITYASNSEHVQTLSDADIMYTSNSDGTWSLEKYTGNDKIVIIRTMAAGKSITNILDGAFAGKESIISVFIGDGITRIKPRAFKDCSSLSFVALPKTLAEISRETFSGCEKLERVLLPTRLGTPEIINEVFADTPISASFDVVTPSIYNGADMVLICANKSGGSSLLDLKEIVNNAAP